MKKTDAKKCAVPGCDKVRNYAEHCGMHHQRLRRDGTTDAKVAMVIPCSVAGCEKPSRARGLKPGKQKYSLCATHQEHFRRTGTLEYRPRIADIKAHRKAYVAKWKRDNWATYSAYLASRKSRMKRATPPWADLAAITKFYKACPRGSHVDHIIPLNGKTVSGLHVLANLQYLSARANMSKGSRLQATGYDPLRLMAKAG